MREDKSWESVRRLAIFVLFCERGEVLSYVESYIRNLARVASRILVVVNGTITDTGMCRLAACGCDVLLRENAGFDFAGWQAGLRHVGWDQVARFDELILCNSSCYSLSSGFEASFERMAVADCDFWGMTQHEAVPDAKLLRHLQSYFLVFRRSMLQSVLFRKYWEALKQIDDWQECVTLLEIPLTCEFEQKGFVSGVCWPTASSGSNPSFFDIDDLVEVGIPLVKRKLFCEKPHVLQMMGRNLAVKVMAWLEKYDPKAADELWEDLLANKKLSLVDRSLHLVRILPDEVVIKGEKRSEKKTAIIVFGFYQDQAAYVCRYLANLPDDVTAIVISSREEVLSAYRERLSGRRKAEFRCCENRGRDLGAMLTVARDVFERFDIVCCAKDKKSPQASRLYAKEFREHCFECLYRSRSYCANVLSLFEEQPRLGIVEPLLYDTYYNPVYLNRMGCNEPMMRDVYRRLNILCPFDDEPLAPFGSMFYARSAAMKTLLSQDWRAEDFPEEPLDVDGTILHAIERFIPNAAQNDGFYTLRVAPSAWVASYLNTFGIRMKDYLEKSANQSAPQSVAKAEEFPSRSFLKCCFLGTFGLTHKKRVHYRRKAAQLLQRAARWNKADVESGVPMSVTDASRKEALSVATLSSDIVNWEGFLALLQSLGCVIYGARAQSYLPEGEERRVLLVSHESEYSGGPMALRNMALALRQMGFCPVYLAPAGGGIFKTLAEDGILSISMPSDFYDQYKSYEPTVDWLFAARGLFEFVVCNTVVTHPVVLKFDACDCKVLWWIHEAEEAYSVYQDKMPEAVSSNVRVLTVSQYADRALKEYRGYETAQLCYPLPDLRRTVADSRFPCRGRVFACVGAVSRRKGQDILVKAIRGLDRSLLEEIRIIFVGKCHDKAVLKEIEGLMAETRQVEYVTSIAPRDMPDFYRTVDCLIVPSRDDPFPMVVSESCSLGRPVIYSDKVGMAEGLHEYQAGKMFSGESSEALGDAIRNMVALREDEFLKLSVGARKFYESNFEAEKFIGNLKRLLDS